MKALPSMIVAAALAIAAAVPAGSAHAACPYPKAPDAVPNGATATHEQMMAAQKAVKDFDRAITDYTECLRLETEAAIGAGGKEMTEQRKEELDLVRSKKHNAAVEAALVLADRFNEQVKVFRQKEKDGK